LKIQIISSHPHGACSYYRAWGVFPKLKDIRCQSIETVSWQQLADADIVFIERPHDPTFVEAAKIVKDFGLKLWVDFDDNLFCLPDWNPAQGFYHSKITKKCLLESMKMADITTVATDEIKEVYAEHCNKIEVIPNAFNDYNFKLDYKPSKNKIVLWRGSNTHRGDIMPYAENIWSTSEENPEWQFHFMGNDLWYITDNITNLATTEELDIIRYFHRIKMISPSIYIVPLAFNKFNAAKSNCGWLEMTYAGAVTLAPNLPEWKKPGIVNYDNENQFKALLLELMNDEKMRRDNYKKSLDFIGTHLKLSTINRKREAIIKRLMK